MVVELEKPNDSVEQGLKSQRFALNVVDDQAVNDVDTNEQNKKYCWPTKPGEVHINRFPVAKKSLWGVDIAVVDT